MRIAGEVRHTFVNGPGIRYAVFFQGCPHACPGCQNPDTHDLRGGKKCSVQDILNRIKTTSFLDGITLTGGDPFMQPKACMELARGAKELGLNIWVYTGYLYEDLEPEYLRDIDVLVDGKFVKSLQSTDCLWRGSTNQRLIDVQASLKAGNVVLYQE